MLMELERKAIVEYGNRLISDRLTAGTAGNLSIYDPGTGYMAISPSGIPYADTTPEDVVIMDLEGNVIEGSRKPSSEFALHSVFYQIRGEQIHAVVHAHSMFCTTLACMGEPLKMVHYALAEIGSYEVPLARYETYGSPELAQAVRDVFTTNANGLLLANHGMVACGDSMKSAFGLALSMEWCAEVQWRCMCAGKANVLTKPQIEEVIEKYKTYGQKAEDGSGPRGYHG